MTTPVDAILKAAGAVTPSAQPQSIIPLLCDTAGILYAKLVAGVTPLSSVALTSDGIAISAGLATAAANVAFNGTSWDRIRASNVFKTVVATASGNTAVWTPTAGKKFRLLAWRLSVAGTLAAAGTQVIQLRDGSTTVIARAGANVAQTLPAGDSQIGEDYGAEGQLSALADNVLNINLGTAMASGGVYIDVWGTEE